MCRQIHEAFASILGTAWRTTELARTLHRRATGFVQENAKVMVLRHEHASGLQRLATELSGVGYDRPRSFREFAEVREHHTVRIEAAVVKTNTTRSLVVHGAESTCSHRL